MPIPPHNMRTALQRYRRHCRKIESSPDALKSSPNNDWAVDSISVEHTLRPIAMQTVMFSPDFHRIWESRNPDEDHFSVPVSVDDGKTGQQISADVKITIREILNELGKN